MSEVIEQEQTTAAAAVDTTTAEQTQTTEQQTQQTTTEQPAQAYEVPKKFLKADGSPDYEKLAKSYVNLEKQIGRKGPIAAQSVDEYEFTPMDGFEVQEDMTTAFKQEALEKGFTADQYKFIMDKYQSILSNTILTADKAEASLKQEWGKDYDTNLAAATRAFDEFAPSDANPNDPIWNHPVVMKLLARMGSELGEDSVAGAAKTSAAPAMTEADVAEIMRSAAYRAGDRELHAKVTAWYQKNRS